LRSLRRNHGPTLEIENLIAKGGKAWAQRGLMGSRKDTAKQTQCSRGNRPKGILRNEANPGNGDRGMGFRDSGEGLGSPPPVPGPGSLVPWVFLRNEANPGNGDRGMGFRDSGEGLGSPPPVPGPGSLVPWVFLRNEANPGVQRQLFFAVSDNQNPP
jgi:hypothetical protein